jgi:hypothetical protein
VVSAAVVRLYRVVLLLYPAEFRRRYGDDMVQLLIDRQLHEHRRASLVLINETFDAVRRAPRMRWESAMNRTVIIAVAGTVVIAAALVAKVILLPLGLLAVAAWLLWGRRARPIASASSSRHWMRWMLAGALAIVFAVAIPTIDGGELNEVWWTVAAVALLGGIAMTITAVVLAASARAHRVASPH